MLTRLEVFRVSRGIKINDLAEECGYHRSHVGRIRRAEIEPSREAIAALVSALRRLSHEDVSPEKVFELSREESGAWRKDRTAALAQEISAYRREREYTGKILAKLGRIPRVQWLAAVEGESSGISSALSRAAIFEGRRLIDKNCVQAEALFDLAAQVAERAPDLTPSYRALLSGRGRLERANALRQIGNYSDALPVLDEAEARFVGVPICTHDLARAWFARGSILFKMDGLREALHYLGLAVNLFSTSMINVASREFNLYKATS